MVTLKYKMLLLCQSGKLQCQKQVYTVWIINYIPQYSEVYLFAHAIEDVSA